MKRELLENYKGYEILNAEGIIVVNKPGADSRHDFIIDLDDSKEDDQPRKCAGLSYENQIEAARNYIDWLNSLRRE